MRKIRVLLFFITSILGACSTIQLNNLVEIKDISPLGRSANDFYPYELDAEGLSKGPNHVNSTYRIHSGDAIELTADGNKQVELGFRVSGDETDNIVIRGNSRIRVPIALFMIGNQVELDIKLQDIELHKYSICLFQKEGKPCRPPKTFNQSPQVRCLNNQSSWKDIHHMIIEGGCGINSAIGSGVETTSGCRPNGEMINCGDVNISINLLPVEQNYLFPGDHFYFEVVARNSKQSEIPQGLAHQWPFVFHAQVDAFGYAYLPSLQNGSEIINLDKYPFSDETIISLKRIADTTTGDVNSRIRTWWPGAIMGRNSTTTESENTLPDFSAIARCLAIGDVKTRLLLSIDHCSRLGADLSRIYPNAEEFERVTYRISPMGLTWTLVDERGHHSEIKYAFGTTLYSGVATHYLRLTGRKLLRSEFGLDRNTAYITVVPNIYRAEALLTPLGGQNVVSGGQPFFVEISHKHKPIGSTNTLIWPGDTVFVTREQPCCAN